MGSADGSIWFPPSGGEDHGAGGAGEAARRVEEGCIGVSREGDGWRVLVRPRAVTRGVAKAFGEWVAGVGDGADRSASCGRGDGTLRAVARAILATSWDAARHPDPASEVAERVTALARVGRETVRLNRLAEAAEAGGELDPEAMRAALSALDSAARRAWQATTACYAGIDRSGSAADALFAIGAPLRRLEGVQEEVEAAYDAAAGALVGGVAVDPGETAVAPTGDPLEALVLLPALATAMEGQAKARRRLQAAVPHRELLVALSTLAIYVSMPRREIAATRAEACAAGLPAARIREIAMYRIGHECGRGYNTLSVQARTVATALRKARSERRPEPDAEGPSP